MGNLVTKLTNFFTQLKAAYRQKIQLKYYIGLCLILVGYGFILFSLIFQGDTRQYEVLAVGQKQAAGSLTYEVVQRKYDTKTSTYRMDLWLSADASFDIYSLDFSANMVLKSTPDAPYETQIELISGRYLVLTTKNIPASFDTIRQDISYTQPSNSTDPNAASTVRTIQLYATENETLFAPFATSTESYQADEINFEITQTEKEIEDLETEIEQNKALISDYRDTIDILESDAKFQVGSDLESTNRKIDTTDSKINQAKEANQTARDQIKLLEEKISLLQEKLDF